MKSMKMLLVVIATICAGRSFAASDVNEMLTDAVKQFRADIKKARIDISKVAVYGIEPDRGGKVNLSVAFDQIENALLDTGKFAVINRKSLQSLLEEQALSLTGIVDESQMVKAGKVIGAQGFFYGSVELEQGRLILSLKLIDVQSSAVVYARKFTGESRNFARLGIGYFYGIAPGIGLDYKAFTKPLGVETVLEPEAGLLSDLAASSYISVLLSYKQGFQELQWALLGIDIAVADYAASKKKALSEDGKTQLLNGPGTTTANYGTIISINSLTALSISPKVYFSPKGILGWESDWITPYAGVSFVFGGFNAEVAGWANLTGTYTSETPFQTKDAMFTFSSVTPLVGVELNLTKSLSGYFEGAFLGSETRTSEGEKGIYLPNDLNFEIEPYVPSGMFLSFGLKYYFNLF